MKSNLHYKTLLNDIKDIKYQINSHKEIIKLSKDVLGKDFEENLTIKELYKKIKVLEKLLHSKNETLEQTIQVIQKKCKHNNLDFFNHICKDCHLDIS
jgi:hypothetical protein